MKHSTSLVTTLAFLVASGAANAGSFVFTDDTDWDTGTYASTNSGPPGADNQVQLDPNIVTQFDFIWVAASGRGTAVLIDTTYDDATDGVVNDGVASLAESASGAGAVIGEYRTAPAGRGADPSRTTVDLNGDVWIGNRAESSGGQGSAVKITSSPGAGPTSSGTWNGGTFNALDWTNAGGADTAGGTSTAVDVAVEQYIRTPGTANRTVAVDANNNVWIGGYNNRVHAQYDTNGNPVGSGTVANGTGGGYGGVIDGNGVLWSSDWANSRIARYDTTAPDPAGAFLGFVATGGRSYGLAVDGNGNIWNSHYDQARISKLDSAGNLLFTTSSGGNGSRGVAVTADNDIWIANSFTNNVTRMDQNGVIQSVIPVGAYPTGISVDSNGKVWVTNRDSNNAQRINPVSNAVELTVDLGGGARPYNYSDMTGSLVGGITNPTGNWVSAALDAGANMIWKDIFWNLEAEGSIPTGSSIDVQVRFADTIAGLAGGTWNSYTSGAALGVAEQFAQVRAILSRPGAQGALSPILSDISLTTAPIPLPASMLLLLGSMGAMFGLRRRSQA